MRRAGVFLLLLACAAPLWADDAPQLRVRLWSLRRIAALRVQPGAQMRVAWGDGAPAVAVSGEFDLRAASSRVVAAGRSMRHLHLSGDKTLRGPDGSALRTHFFLTIGAERGELTVTAQMPLEEYVAAAVQGESAAAMPAEALRALAVAARSYAWRIHASGAHELVDSTADQHLELDASPAAREAARSTAGEFLWVNGRLLAAYHHAECGGRTEAAADAWPDQASPALVSHEDVYCQRASQPWRAQLTAAQIDAALRSAGLSTPRGWRSLRVVRRSASGRARMLAVGDALFSASTLRTALGRMYGWATLKSDLYEVESRDGVFVFRGRGVGHGVGLCQRGAAEMASAGKTWREILAYYYPGAVVGRSAQGVSWIEEKGPQWTLQVMRADELPELRRATAEAWREVESRTGLRIGRVVVAMYDDASIFRDATGEPGWVAASTRDGRIRLQRPRRGGLTSPLRHELTHCAVEGAAAPGEPLWWREGLALLLNGEELAPSPRRMRKQEVDAAIAGRGSQASQSFAYAEALRLVREIEKSRGRATMLEWLRHGLPRSVAYD